MPGGESWVTTALDDWAGVRALVLARCLRRVISTKKLTLLTTKGLSDSLRLAIEKEFDVVLNVDLDHPVTSILGPEGFLKLFIWKLTFFHKCVFVHPDCFLLDNCDALFNHEAFSAVEDVERKGYFDPNVFVCKPSFVTWNDMIQMALNGSLNGNKHDPLNAYFKHWKHQQPEKCLKHEFNYPVHNDATFDYQILGMPRIVRFLGPKPWHTEVLKSEPTDHYHVLWQTWRNVFTEEVLPSLPQTKTLVMPKDAATFLQSFQPNSVKESRFIYRNLKDNNLNESIAIVGLSCRYPGANNVSEFWNLLVEGKDAISSVPTDRWHHNTSDLEESDFRRTNAGFLSCAVDTFDSKFFGISPREAAFIDPQQRLVLEVSWESLESAGINPMSLKGSDTGVYIGVWAADYERMLRCNAPASEAHRIYLGNSYSATSARISYFLGLNGPNIATESGCSSSFVSLHLACDALRKGECSLALAGGVNLLLHPFSLIGTNKPYFLAPDGHCKTFDASADGFGRAEGCGIVVLKRFSDAQRDGDQIMAIVRGSAINSEGTTASFGTPSKACQEAVIREALKTSQVDPVDIDYVEAHGTGTIVGDPIEMSALASAYGEASRLRNEPLIVGSVKTNIGHTEGAAGVAGLIKVILAMENEVIPPHRNFSEINPGIKLDEIPAKIPLEAQPWPRTNNKRRIAGVSSFGISGTNVHVIVEEPPKAASVIQRSKIQCLDRPEHLMTLSAKTESALNDLIAKHTSFLRETDSKISFADVAFTCNTGRAHLIHRVTVIAKDVQSALKSLEKKKYTARGKVGQKSPVAFLFTGQGSQYAGMARKLYETQPVFRKTLKRCAHLLKNNLDIDLLDVMWKEDDGSKKIDQTLYSQTSIFCVEVSLLALWSSFGIRPDYVLGHSVGEFAAAVAAGVMTLEDALKLVSERSTLIQGLPQGGMLAVKAPVDNVRTLIKSWNQKNPGTPKGSSWLDVSVVNSPEEVVVAGRPSTLEAFSEFCTQQNVKTLRVAASHAFHSREMDAILNDFGKVASSIDYKPPRCNYVSGRDGKVLQEDSMSSVYWQNHARDSVNFPAGLRTLVDAGVRTFIEVGAHPILLAQALSNLSPDEAQDCTWVPSIRKNEEEWTTLLTALAKVYVAGQEINWEGYECPYAHLRSKVSLPTYPFQRGVFWFESAQEPDSLKTNTKTLHPLIGKCVPVATGELSVTVFQQSFLLDNLPYLNDHQVANKVILPGAGFLEMVLATGHATTQGLTESFVCPERPVVITDFTIECPFEILPEKNQQIQIVASKLETQIPHQQSPPNSKSDEYKVTIFRKIPPEESGGAAGARWRRHATAKFISSTAAGTAPSMDLDQIKNRLGASVDTAEMYAKAPEIGIYFGPNFQSIRKFWKSANEILAELTSPEVQNGADGHGTSGYVCHPVILDALIQAYALRLEEEKTALYLPVGVDEFTWFSKTISPHSTLYGHMTYDASGSQNEGTMTLLDDTGNVLCQLKNIRLVRTNVAAFINFLNAQKRELPGLYMEVFRPKVGTWMNRIDLKDVPSSKIIASNLETFIRDLQELVEIQETKYVGMSHLIDMYIVNTFYELGWRPHLGEILTSRDLMTSLIIAARHEGQIEVFFDMLVEQGYLIPAHDEEEGTRAWKLVKLPPSKEKMANVIEGYKSDFSAAIGENDVQLPIVARLGKNMGSILTGKESGLGVLFPEETEEVPAWRIYTDTEYCTMANETVQRVVEASFAHLSKSNTTDSKSSTGQAGVVRVLEIGAGTGSTSEFVFAAFKKLGIPFYYTFTDIAPTFLHAAAQKFKDVGRVTYKILNIEEDPKNQGYAPHSFDMVIASNVLHATANLDQTMKNLRHLLAPGGLHVLFEMFQPVKLIDYIFGILDGYWKFNDLHLRPHHPVINYDQWSNVLTSNGFDDLALLPTWGSRFGVIVAKSTVIAPLYIDCNLTKRDPSATWLIFADETGVAAHLQELMLQNNKQALLIKLGKEYRQLAQENVFEVNPFASYGSIFDHVSSNQGIIEGIIYSASIGAGAGDEEKVTSGLLQLTQTLLSRVSQFKTLPRFYIATQGMYAVEDQIAIHPIAGIQRGFLLTFKSEQPGLRCGCIDVDPEDTPDHAAKELFNELWTNEAEIHVAFRARKRFVNRCVPRDPPPAPLLFPPAERYKLSLPKTLTVADLTLGSAPTPEVGENHVEIAVRATGLNFRDLFVIMKPDMYTTDFEDVGMEFSGTVTRVGSKVKRFRNGDEVFGISQTGAVASHTLVREDMIMPKPKKITFAQASTMPIAFFTAYHCLVEVADLRPGENILIHVASGGVGLAAVQIAKHIGANIIATAGSKRKRAYLTQTLGIPSKCIFHSRNTLFGQGIDDLLGPQGIHVVLNSLTGPNFKETSLKICSQGARFVEMSKISIWKPDEVVALRPDVKYTIVNLEHELERKTLAQKVEEFINSGVYTPLPCTRFDVTQVKEAFTYFQQAHHIGKVVVTMPEIKYSSGSVEVAENLFNAQSTYLITGGLGGIGLEVAKFMGKHGARHLVLAGRHAPSEQGEEVIKSLSQKGVKVVALQVDVGDRTACEQMLASLADPTVDLPPLRGVMHAAGVLSDGMIINQSMDKFNIVFNAKVRGAWNLHELTKSIDLEHFVLYSSGAAVLGPLGQSNHAAGNTFLDTLAHYRHSLGLPAQTINWGIWSEVGAAAAMALGKEGAFGIKPFTPAQGIAALKAVLKSHYTQTIVMEINYDVFKQDVLQIGSYIEELIHTSSSASKEQMQAECDSLWAEIQATPPEQRPEVIKLRLEGMLRQTLKMADDEPIDEHQNFSEMGMDSLMAVEMRNKLQMVFGKHMTLNATALLDHPNLASLSSYLAELTEKIEAQLAGGAGTTISSPKNANNTKDVKQTDNTNSKEERAEMLSLVKEDSILPEHICLPEKHNISIKSPKEFRVILLTGSTGQLGVYMLSQLTQQDMKILCLIRGKTPQDAQKRLTTKLRKFNLLSETDMSKVECVPGNISEPNLGLGPSKYAELAERVDAIVHCAVKGNHVEKYKRYANKSNHDLRSVNVLGTVRILELAVTSRVKPVCHMSSVVAAGKITADGRVSEEYPEDNDFGDKITWGYALSKFVCEKLMKQASERGLPITLLRYPTIVGHSKSGMFSPESNHLMLFLLACIHLGLAPEVDGSWSSLSVDIAASLGLKIFLTPSSSSNVSNQGVFNITNPRVSDQEAIVRVVQSKGFGLKIVPYADWTDGLLAKGESSLLFPLKDIYLKEGGFSSFIRSTPATQEAFSSASQQSRLFDLSDKTLTFVEDVQSTFPSCAEIIHRHLDFAKKNGTLKMFGLD